MPSFRAALASLPALPAGVATAFAHAPYAAVGMGAHAAVLAVLPVIVRWYADSPRRERDRIGNQALAQIAQTDPTLAVQLLAKLPPPANPYKYPARPEGPAPPTAAPGDPAADTSTS